MVVNGGSYARLGVGLHEFTDLWGERLEVVKVVDHRGSHTRPRIGFKLHLLHISTYNVESTTPTTTTLSRFYLIQPTDLSGAGVVMVV